MQFSQKGPQKANLNLGRILSQKKNHFPTCKTVKQPRHNNLTHPPQPLPHLQALPQPQLPPQQEDIFSGNKNKRRRKEDNDEEQVTTTLLITHQFEFQEGAMLLIYNTISGERLDFHPTRV